MVCVVVAALGARAGEAAAEQKAPPEWDPRIAPYVEIVEQARGLGFERPVRVRFLSDAAFRKAATAWYDDVTDEDRELADLETSDLLALGLATEPLDLLEAEQEADAEGTYGWYDDEREEMVVRGTNVGNVDVRVTIVHELVHALQDQHFDLEMLQSRVRTAGEQFALDAIVEGDASRVELEYLWSLPQKEQDAYWAAYEAVDTSAAGEADAAPSYPLVLALFSAIDYDLAPVALDVAVASRGRGAIDRLLRSPPRSEESIIDPVALDEHDSPAPVELPAFGVGEAPKGPADDWGAFSWYLLLASRIPWHDALDAAEGWGGDRYRSFVRTTGAGEQGCVRLAVTGDTARDTDQLEAAIGAWVTAMPPGVGQSTRHDERVVLSACATGAAATPSDDALQDAYDRLWERTDQMALFVERDWSLREARCASNGIVADDVARPLLYADRELTKSEDRRLGRRYDRALSSCA